ncbi:MAG: dihydroorotate dehydrogenase electron transfer subunit [Magnetococcales bacterium]|nr:dihydroorotate dehydrogenase electron transfer subunit [Magnetococcales bacterium]
MCQPASSRQTTATVLFNKQLTPNQYLLRLHAPDVAKESEPGHFIHLNCHPSLTLPRPFSIMDADVEMGTLDIFYQVVGEGTEYMQSWQAGLETPLLGPIGRSFRVPDADRFALLIAGGIGYAPLDFFARLLKKTGVEITVLLGIEREAPFELISATPLPHELIENPITLARLQEQDIVSRVASLQPKPGFFHGYVTELASGILQNISAEQRLKTDLYCCGPTPMMKAAAAVAKEFNLGGQVSLEEHMACGFGGCAGCVAPIKSAEGWGYQRVCTDGPVFAINDVVWEKI